MMLRLATPEDMPSLIKLAVTFIRQSPYKDEPYDEDEIRDLLSILLRDRNKGIVVLLMKDDLPVGFIGGMLTKMFFSKDPLATEIFWWVDPQYRTRKSLLLKEAFEFWAKRVGAKYISLSSPAQDPRVARFYERTGYIPIENAHMKKVA